MMFWSDSHWVFWQVALMWVGMVAFWGLIIWAVWALIGSTTQKPQQDHRGDDARRILDQRLAKGEIETEEYRRLRELIAHDDHAPIDAGANR
ncbi:MAG: SHOCT domain-containing protein [Acidimicrobiales bacterium]|nr:SHOCT domain-containing protein [Acidimicrobiales bacterium]